VDIAVNVMTKMGAVKHFLLSGCNYDWILQCETQAAVGKLHVVKLGQTCNLMKHAVLV